MNYIVRDNLIKNIIVIIILIVLYFPINAFLQNSPLVTDRPTTGDVLVAVSIIAVIACFGNFAFTYERVDTKKKSVYYLAHITTGILMFLIGISLIFTKILLTFLMGKFFIMDITLFLVYIAAVGYDFWDLQRITL